MLQREKGNEREKQKERQGQKERKRQKEKGKRQKEIRIEREKDRGREKKTEGERKRHIQRKTEIEPEKMPLRLAPWLSIIPPDSHAGWWDGTSSSCLAQLDVEEWPGYSDFYEVFPKPFL